MSADWLKDVAEEDFCYLTTTGRVSGRPHTIEIWFGVRGDAIYLMAGGRDRADWVRNLRKEPVVEVRFGSPGATAHAGHARVVDAQTDPQTDAAARHLLAAKYQEWQAGEEGRTLSGWARTALPVEIRFDAGAGA
jgi:deazaflavin-dependent oxidoreductase (nitroreductase family)